MEIYITRDGERYGPYSLTEVQADIDAGNIRPSDLAWHEGATGWIEVWQVDGITIPKRRVPPPPPPSASPVYNPNPPPKSSGGELVILILLTVLLPIVGLIVGIIRISKPERRNEGGILLLVALCLMIIYALLFSQM